MLREYWTAPIVQPVPARLSLRLEKKGRGGKAVTVVAGLSSKGWTVRG